MASGGHRVFWRQRETPAAFSHPVFIQANRMAITSAIDAQKNAAE